jgi:hypothetical protein
MPSSLVIAAYFGAGAAGLTAATAALGVSGLIAARFAINFAVSMIVTRLFTSSSANQNVDNGVRQQVPPATTNSLPIVYGDAYLGGVFVDAVLSTDQKTMYYVLAISQVSPNGQFSFDTTNFYWQDQTITFDGTDLTKVISLIDGAGNPQTKISGNLFIYLYRSNEAGTITALNGSALPSTVMGGTDIAVGQRWPASNRQMNGTAFAIVKMIYNRDAGTTQMQAVTFKVAQYLNSTGVAKPGDVWYDYITNTKYGCAMDSTIVDSASGTALNAYADQTITYTPSGGGSATQARYRINGVLDTGQDVLSNLDQIMLACDSWNQYNAATGKWSVVINKADSATFAFDDSNIVGEIRVSAFDISSSINQIQAQFPSKLNRDQSDYVYLNTPTALLYVNEPPNKYTITLGLVNDSVQAQYLANRMLEQAREDLIVTFATTYNGIQVDAGDVITVTNAAYGWSSKLFRVIKVSEASLPDGNLGAALELNEYNAAVYDDAPITAFAATPNSNLSNPNFFTNLVAPTVTNVNTTATIPHFDVVCGIPATGRTTEITLFYTNLTSPTSTDWKVWSFESVTNSQPFAPSTNVTFTDINLPTDTYYFAFKVSNETGASALSASSTGFSWLPNPTTTAVAGTFLATFSPVVMQVSRDVSLVPSFTGLITQLYGSAAGGAIDFVTAQADTDASFVNNTWRIGASSTTGNGDISTNSGLVLPSPTDGGTFAQWGIPTAMTSSPATLTVPVRYKSALGTVSQGATSILQFVFVDQGATGGPGASGNQAANPALYQWSTTTPANPSGQSTYTWATGVNSSYTGGGGWTTTIPANPTTAGILLWTAIKPTVVAAGTASSTISWTSGFTISSVSANGVDGVKTASAVVYQWAVTLPSSPTGTSTYTWSSNSFTPNPSGWSSSITTSPSVGYTLWAARVNISDTASATSTTINWTLSSIIAAGYAGDDGSPGSNGTRTAILDVYQWSVNAPTTFPSGSSTYTWATGQFTAPSTLNNWYLTPPSSVLGQTLWIARTIYADINTTATTAITWSASTATPISASGTNGSRTAFLEVYRWAATTPTSFPSGTSTYTWATGAFTAPSTPNGWSLLPGASTPNYNLYACQVNYVDTLTTATSSVTWSTSTAYVVGFAGDNGSPGDNGASSRICYSKTTLTSLNSTPATITTSGSATFPPNGSWGLGTVWQDTPQAIIAGESVYQSDGIYNPVTGNTVWNVPYLSTLKVGSLSAITVNTGALTVQDALTINTLGHIKGGQTAYNTGTGFFLGYSSTAYKFSIGSSTQSLVWDGTALTVTGNITGNGTAEFTGINTVSGVTYAVKANSTSASDSGLIGYTQSTIGAGVIGNSTNSGAYAVVGTATNASNVASVLAQASGSATIALEVRGGAMITDNSTLVANLNAEQLNGLQYDSIAAAGTGTGNYVGTTKPSSTTTNNEWIKIKIGGVFYFIPAWQ